jgi:hypothetical protein
LSKGLTARHLYTQLDHFAGRSPIFLIHRICAHPSSQAVGALSWTQPLIDKISIELYKGRGRGREGRGRVSARTEARSTQGHAKVTPRSSHNQVAIGEAVPSPPYLATKPFSQKAGSGHCLWSFSPLTRSSVLFILSILPPPPPSPLPPPHTHTPTVYMSMIVISSLPLHQTILASNLFSFSCLLSGHSFH